MASELGAFLGDEATDPNDSDDRGSLDRYKREIKLYDTEFEKFHSQGKQIIKRYRDKREPKEMIIGRYNILYANTDIMLPAIYAQNPVVNIERRFRDDDILGRVASDVLERATSYFVQNDEFRDSMRAVLLDSLLPGRGVSWSRYVPHFKDMDVKGDSEVEDLGDEITDNEASLEPEGQTEGNDPEPMQEVVYEEVANDYVHWRDFVHNWARTWNEVNLVGRKVYLTKGELIDRFGEEKAKLCPLDYKPKGVSEDDKDITLHKSVIYELWDKTTKKASWIHMDVDEFLDQKDDPLRLPDFFPCPRPLFACMDNDCLVPVAYYTQYKDQADELDELTGRAIAMEKSLKVVGLYDASAQGIERMLSEGIENRMLPVENWAMLSEKGGMKGVMDFWPVEVIAKTLLSVYDARDRKKADIDEIIGISDIKRGNTDPNETLGAQQMKGQSFNGRLKEKQAEMARYCKQTVMNTAIIIAEHFSIDTIKKISGVQLFDTPQEKQAMQQQLAQAQQHFQQAQQIFQAQKQQQAQPPQGGQPGQPAQPPRPQMQPPQPPPPVPLPIQDMLQNPTWQEVEQLFRNEPALCFKIDIEIDSTILADEEKEKASRVDFLEAVAVFLEKAVNIPPPLGQKLMPMMGQMLLFAVRGFKVGKELEGQIRLTIQQLEKWAQSPQATPPNPEMIKVQADIQEQQARAQADKVDAQNDAQMKMAEQKQASQFKQQEQQQKADLEMKEMQMDAALDMRKTIMQTSADVRKHKMTLEATPPQPRGPK